jgi:hypothetical protein
MKILSKKLQVRFICKCGYKFTNVYGDGKINTKDDDTHDIKFIYARCPKCQEMEEFIIYRELK